MTKRAPFTSPCGNVFRRQPAAMGFSDLPADGEAEAQELRPECLARGTAVGVEALENAVDRVGPDAGPVVLDGHDVEFPGSRQMDGDVAAFLGHEGARILYLGW